MLIRRAAFYNAFVDTLAKGKQGEFCKLILRNIGTARYLLQISYYKYQFLIYKYNGFLKMFLFARMARFINILVQTKISTY